MQFWKVIIHSERKRG